MGQRCDPTFLTLWTGLTYSVLLLVCVPDLLSLLHHRCPCCGTLFGPLYCGKSGALSTPGLSRSPFLPSLVAALLHGGGVYRPYPLPYSHCIPYFQVETDAVGVALAQSYEVVETALQPKVACTLGANSEKAYKMALSSEGSIIAVAIEVCHREPDANVAT